MGRRGLSACQSPNSAAYGWLCGGRAERKVQGAWEGKDFLTPESAEVSHQSQKFYTATSTFCEDGIHGDALLVRGYISNENTKLATEQAYDVRICDLQADFISLPGCKLAFSQESHKNLHLQKDMSSPLGQP